MNRSTPGLPVHHQLPEFTQTHVHLVGDAIQPSHPLSFTFPPAPNPSHRWVWRNGRGPHLEGRQEPQASSPFRTPTAGSRQSWDRRVRPRLEGKPRTPLSSRELQLCAQARERRAPAERLLWPGRASPSASELLAFSPGKEQAAGVWETCLAPGWLPFRILISLPPHH